jgi:hypothetical protein
MKLRVWHNPQIPGPIFYINVDSIEEGIKTIDILSAYDSFQYKNNIKPDYCNVSGLEIFENGEWTEWYDEATGEDFSGYATLNGIDHYSSIINENKL